MNILLVDDFKLFREEVASLLDRQPDMTVVGQAGSVKEAIAKAKKLKPDVILMDIGLPDGNGIEATRQILADQPELKIVFLTVYESDELLYEAIQSGGQGYLSKNMRIAELLDMVRGLERGEAAISRQVASRILAEFARMRIRLEGAPALADQDSDIVLTLGEGEMLKLVARGVSSKEIAEQLVVSESNVKHQMSNILNKLHLKNQR
jgi:DNA-binding NarL/FixJ family response regulator